MSRGAPSTPFDDASSSTESKPVGNPTKEGIAKVQTALHEWYKHLTDSATLGKRADPLTKRCQCGQPIVQTHRTALFDNDALKSDADEDDVEDEEILHEYEGDERLKQVFRRLFNRSDTQVMFLVLDHLLPHNVLDVIYREGIANCLWGFRGTDRMRVMALMEALKYLKNCNQVDFDVKLCKCAYSDSNQLTAENILLGQSDEEMTICSCMVKCFSTMTADVIQDRYIETGNEGEQHEFRYEFAGIMIYPRSRKPSVLASIFNSRYYTTFRLAGFLSDLTSNDELLEFLDNVQRNPKRTLIEDMATSDLGENEAAIALAKRLPLSFLLSDVFLGPVDSRMSSRLRVASVMLVLYRLTLDERCLIDASGQTQFNLVNVVDVIQTCATTFTDEKKRLVTVGKLAVDLAILGQTEAFDDLVFTRFADHPALQQVTFTMVVSRQDKLEEAVSSDWLDGCRVRIQERLEAWLKERMESSDDKRVDREAEIPLQTICSLIRTWSTPGSRFYSMSLRLAETILRSDREALEFVVKTWFSPYSDEPFSGTIVMRPIVEAFCSAKVKAMDDHLVKRRAELARDIPSRWPDALKAFVTGSEMSIDLPGYTGRRLESSGHLYQFGIREVPNEGFARDFPDIAAREIEYQKGDRTYVSKLTNEMVWE